MSTLKGLLFSQYACDGLANLVTELQHQYKSKKGRRFNHGNITYEIGRPILKENYLEFEISSKIPQDEIKSNKDMKTYFSEIRKILNSEKIKPVSMEMENIIWDSKKETEKERDYVKLLYQYSLSDLYDEKEVIKRFEDLNKGEGNTDLPDIPGVHTIQGKLVLVLVRENMQNIGRDHVNILINANKKVKASI